MIRAHVKPNLYPAPIPISVALWARESVRNLINGSILNIRLREAGICDKLLCDMTDAELERYSSLIEELRRIMIKKLSPP